MQPHQGPLSYEPLSPVHAKELHGALRDESLYRFIPELPPRSLRALQDEYAEFSAGAPPESGQVWLNWAIRDNQTEQCIGMLQATRFADGMLWIGYKIVPSAWNRGFATTALQWLTKELRIRFRGQSILAAVDTRNTASIRVLQKCGFTVLRTEPAELHGEQTEDFIYQLEGHAACTASAA